MKQGVWSLALVSLVCALEPARAVEIGVKSLSGPPEEFAAKRLPSAADTAVPSSILMIDRAPRDGSGKAVVSGTTFSSFSTSPGVGFSLVQVTTQYPYFAPVTISAPNGNLYVFNGSTLSCNFGLCGDSQASVDLQAFAQSAGGAATLSISGGEVSGGSWGLTVQDPTPAALRLAAAPLQVETLLSFDDNVVTVEVVPDPCLAKVALCPAPDPCLGKLTACPAQPDTVGRRNAIFDLVEGAAPVLRLSFANREMKSRGLESGVGLTRLQVTVVDTRTKRAFHQETLSGDRVAGLKRDDAGSSLLRLPSLPVGQYSVRLDIRGNLPGVGPFERTAFYYLPILARRYRMTGDAATSVLDDRRLQLVLDVDSPARETKHVYAYAEVWTRDGKKPIAWIGGMTQPETSRSGHLGLPLVLDTRWLALAGAVGPDFLLRNVRLEDPDTFIPIDEMEELPFTVRELPKAASLAKAKVVMDDSLYVGAGDRTISVEDAAIAAGSPVDKGFADTGIFLVHGWCSNPVWPVGQFGRPGRVGGTGVFSDPSASRSNDTFAQLIRNQGNAYFNQSFTVVAHSQGGVAATHLRAYYTSLLDLSSAPRRIQTMGSPYGGSTLMDLYLATGPLGYLIAEIFGFCTPQFDLGTLGSALWKSNLPSWVRGDVYYYRAGYRKAHTFWEKLQFWRWRCNLASFVIPGWDDGVVSVDQGVLSGAHDMGVTEGECHTVGMNHPAETANSSRNDILDQLGRSAALNLARSATTSASSTYTPGCSPGLNCYFASRVNDGDRSTTLGGNTSWANGNGQPMPQWVQLHWPSAITFSRVNLYLTTGYEISSFRIEYRASATAAWQTLAAVSGNVSATLGPYNAPFPVAAQDIRVLGLSGPAIQPGYIRVNEIEVY